MPHQTTLSHSHWGVSVKPARLCNAGDKDKLEVGDFISAKLLGKDDCRQGVLSAFNSDGTITVEGLLPESPYTCELPATLIPNKNIIFNRKEILAIQDRVRHQLK